MSINLKNLLTSIPESCYLVITTTIRAFSGLRRDAERGFLVLGTCCPECLSVARLGAVLIDRSNARGIFYCLELINTITIRRYHYV